MATDFNGDPTGRKFLEMASHCFGSGTYFAFGENLAVRAQNAAMTEAVAEIDANRDITSGGCVEAGL
jgi:hypothetical protein